MGNRPVLRKKGDYEKKKGKKNGEGFKKRRKKQHFCRNVPIYCGVFVPLEKIFFLKTPLLFSRLISFPLLSLSNLSTNFQISEDIAITLHKKMERFAVVAQPTLAKVVKQYLELHKLMEKGYTIADHAVYDKTSSTGNGVVFLTNVLPEGGISTEAITALEGVVRICAVPVQKKEKKVQQPPKAIPKPPKGSQSSAPLSFYGASKEILRVDVSNFTREQRNARMANLLKDNIPAVLTGFPIGNIAEWGDVEYLKGKTEGIHVAAQVCAEDKVDLAGHRTKGMKANFSFNQMPFAELVERCNGMRDDYLVANGERYYLRSVPEGKMKSGSHFPSMFPNLAEDFNLSGILDTVSSSDVSSYHSSALRVTSPGLELWTHYDMMQNLLVQSAGQKTITLFPPSAAPFLYVQGTSSRIDSVDSPDKTKFPLARFALEKKIVFELCTGEVLFIPPLWFHHTVSGERLSLAVNIFLEEKKRSGDYHPKDFYGNKDLPSAETSIEEARDIGRSLKTLGGPHGQFYAVRAAEALLQAAGLTASDAFSLTAPPQYHKIIILTGGFGGIGFEIARGIASAVHDNNTLLLLPTRRAENGIASEQLEELAGWCNVTAEVVYGVDLSERETVYGFVHKVRHEYVSAKEVVLINNAAVVSRELQLTSDGVEMQFAVSVLAPYRLIHAFADIGLTRVVNVASNWTGEYYLKNYTNHFEKYSAAKAYRASKQAERMITRSLARSLPGITIVACHPGVVGGTSVSSTLGLKTGTHTPAEGAVIPLRLVLAERCESGVMVSESGSTEDVQWSEEEEGLITHLAALC